MLVESLWDRCVGGSPAGRNPELVPSWPRGDPPASSGSFVSRAEPASAAPTPFPAGAPDRGWGGVCVRACVCVGDGGAGAGRTFDAAHPPQPRVGEVPAGAAGRGPVVHGQVAAVADVRAGVEPVVGADGDGHEREGGEGSGRGQQHLQPAVASHHGGRLIVRRPPARPAAPARPLSSARRSGGARAGGAARAGGRRRAPSSDPAPRACLCSAARGSNSEARRRVRAARTAGPAGCGERGLLPLGPPSPRGPRRRPRPAPPGAAPRAAAPTWVRAPCSPPTCAGPGVASAPPRPAARALPLRLPGFIHSICAKAAGPREHRRQPRFQLPRSPGPDARPVGDGPGGSPACAVSVGVRCPPSLARGSGPSPGDERRGERVGASRSDFQKPAIGHSWEALPPSQAATTWPRPPAAAPGRTRERPDFGMEAEGRCQPEVLWAEPLLCRALARL